MTLMIVFPNFTEQPVFAEPGKTVKMDGSASNLKELKVEGTDDNKLMNAFREQIANASPPEMVKYAGRFIEDHPASAVGSYLVRKYFIQSARPDYDRARQLLALMIKHQPDNGYLKRLQQHISGLGKADKGDAVPAFSALDVEGGKVSEAALSQNPAAVVCAWASWSYESINVLRQIAEMQKESEGKWNLLGICVDASVGECRKTMRNNRIDCPVICDGDMLDGRVYRLFGFAYVPEFIIVKNGRIAERDLNVEELKKKLKNL